MDKTNLLRALWLAEHGYGRYPEDELCDLCTLDLVAESIRDYPYEDLDALTESVNLCQRERCRYAGRCACRGFDGTRSIAANSGGADIQDAASLPGWFDERKTDADHTSQSIKLL